jgi:hypothetical protein
MQLKILISIVAAVGGLAALDAAQSVSLAAGPSGTPGLWQPITIPALNGGDPAVADGDTIQSIMADPVNPGVFYAAAGNNDGRHIKWLRTIDFGDTWTLRNDTAMNGNPWGFSIDPNPNRAPVTLPTLYSPAGYGSFGAWKSTDGASTWTRLTGADAAFGPYNPTSITSPCCPTTHRGMYWRPTTTVSRIKPMVVSANPGMAAQPGSFIHHRRASAPRTT